MSMSLNYTAAVGTQTRAGGSRLCCQCAVKSVSLTRMFKALFLIFEPVAAWGRVAQARRGLVFVFAFYLLPTMLIVAEAEGFGLVKWGKLQFNIDQIKRFTVGEAAIY